ncbi:MAG: CotH kinase family protein [Pirellulaceae bacterium]
MDGWSQVAEADAGVDFDPTMRMGRRRIEATKLTELAINWRKNDPNRKIGQTDRRRSGLLVLALATLVADGPGGRGFGGPGGGRGFGGPGGPGHGGVDLDPLVNIDNERMPLRRQLLAVPALKQRYLQCVKTIAQDSLDWSELQNSIAAYRSLIQEEVQQDVKKTTSTDAFINATRTDDSDESPGSLKSFFEGRRKYLLSYEAIESLPDAQVPVFFAASETEVSARPNCPKLRRLTW